MKSGVADFVAKPKKCVTKKFNLDVRGTQIAKVTFKIDGKKIKALSKPDSARAATASPSTRCCATTSGTR